VVHDEAGAGFVIDPGYEYEKVIDAVRGLQISHILITHAHYDHIGGAAKIKEITGASVCIHPIERDWLTDPLLNLSALNPEYVPWPVAGPPADRLLQGGEVLSLLGEEIE